MTCSTHPDIEAVAYCGHCGRALCAGCRREVRGVSYCENCLAARLQGGVFGAGFGSSHSPGTALVLGFIPGVGAIYNGQILKAIVQVLIFGSLCALGDQSGNFSVIFGLGAAAFYCYMVIDSYQTARRRQLGEPVDEWLGGRDLEWHGPIVAGILIALGALFLLDNLGINIFSQIGRFWPILLIAFGVMLLERRLGARRVSTPRGVPPRPGANPGTGGGFGGTTDAGPKEL
jgi:hypothetical protein